MKSRIYWLAMALAVCMILSALATLATGCAPKPETRSCVMTQPADVVDAPNGAVVDTVATGEGVIEVTTKSAVGWRYIVTARLVEGYTRGGCE